MLSKYGDIVCDECGRFISYTELSDGRATHRLLTPDSHFSGEEYESFHNRCARKIDAAIRKIG